MIRFLATIDFETYYDSDFSLGKLTTEEYIRDPRFEPLCVGIHMISLEERITRRICTENMEQLRRIPWHETAVLAHNTLFDAGILSLHFGIQPAYLYDTLSMARYLHATDVGMSLKRLAEHYEVGEKGTEVIQAKGKRRADFTENEFTQYMQYCLNDVDLTLRLFQKMRHHFTRKQFDYINLVLRFFTRPLLHGDVAALQQYIDDTKQEQRELLLSLGLGNDPQHIAKFLRGARGDNLAQELQKHGALIPYKLNPKGVPIYAFAQTDKGMEELLNSDNPKVAALAAAKLNVQSTGPVAKAQRFLDMAKRGPMCIPAAVYGTHTGRLTSSDGLNFLNMQRGNPIREGLVAPPGYVIVAGDAAQIQARLAMWLAKCEYFLDLFRRNDAGELDVYCAFGSEHIYGRPITKADKAERQVAKRAVLGLGFRMGVDRFRDSVLADGRVMKIAVPQEHEIYERAHKAFRTVAYSLNNLWRHLEDLADVIIMGDSMIDSFRGIMRTTPDGLLMPDGMTLRFPQLQRDDDSNNSLRSSSRRSAFKFMARKNKWEHTHGGPLLNNVIQNLEQIHMQTWQLAMESYGYPVAFNAYDEIVCVVPEGDAVFAERRLREVMCTPEPWAEGLPLYAEVGIGTTYGNVVKE